MSGNLSRIALLSGILIAACGRTATDDESFVSDILLADGVAHEVAEEIEASLLSGVARADVELALTGLDLGFRGSFPVGGTGRSVDDDGLDVRVYGAFPEVTLEREMFVARLREHVADWENAERVDFDTDRFFLSASGESARGRAELRLAGRDSAGGGVELRVQCEVELSLDKDSRWRLTRFETTSGTRLAGGPAPFREISNELGFGFHTSPVNRDMLQAALNEHQTLALGGLTALDWNRDGFWDLLGTQKEQLSVLFLNDGRGGFERKPLPVRSPLESSNFYLWLDLDNDGLEELVGTLPMGYEGDRGYLGIYTRRDGVWILLDRALEFPNPVGVRYVSIPTIVPCDVNADGLMDLVAGVYGDGRSRGDRFNTVLAHDGGNNHLFVNHGDLRFSEESEMRGITGTQYTYVIQPFDFDGDGDIDLLEGNDFGPNVLWENNGDGRFRADRESVLSGESAYTMGATLADPDNTGKWSLYLSNMSSHSGARIANFAEDLSDEMRERLLTIAGGNMIHTQGSDGSWTEEARALHCNEGGWAWGSNFCDLDNDGDQDLVVTNGFTSHSQRELPDW